METLLILTGTVNRLVEFVKRILEERTAIPEGTRHLLVFFAQLVIGIGTVFIAQTQVDVLAGTPFERMGLLWGTVFAGMSISLGAEFIHYLLDLTKNLTPTTTSATVTVSNPTTATSPQASASVSVGVDTPIIAKG